MSQTSLREQKGRSCRRSRCSNASAQGAGADHSTEPQRSFDSNHRSVGPEHGEEQEMRRQQQ